MSDMTDGTYGGQGVATRQSRQENGSLHKLHTTGGVSVCLYEKGRVIESVYRNESSYAWVCRTVNVFQHISLQLFKKKLWHLYLVFK